MTMLIAAPLRDQHARRWSASAIGFIDRKGGPEVGMRLFCQDTLLGLRQGTRHRHAILQIEIQTLGEFSRGVIINFPQ